MTPTHRPTRCLIHLLLLATLGLSPVARGGTLAMFRTPLGELDVELFDQEKPITVQNFLSYVASGVYSNMFLHRCVPGFIVQGGGFFVTNPFTAPAIEPVPQFAPITNEFNVGPRLANTYGTLAMAKVSGATNSATAQWFFNLADNSTNLDNQNGGFTVFGRVVGGTNVLNRFNDTSGTNGITEVDFSGVLGAPFDTLPILYHGQTNVTYADLIYTQVSVLRLQVTLDAGGRELSWNSVSNRLNTVEFATHLPPTWQTLVSTPGTGGPLQATDPATNSPTRFYRVRIDFSAAN
ncbi:MAG: peptidylprolyl isomerase [Verrucomicrobia bacterium]|nr:peptidylprolyl isomerase [Verrucomicrobiota bacterium]